MRIGIIGAMDSEVNTLHAAMEDCREETAAGNTFYVGRIGSVDTVLVKSGVGKVCAALCAQLLIDRFQIDTLLNTGIAGGVAEGLSVGDLIVAEGALHHDFDISAFGHAKGWLSVRGGDDQKPSIFPTDPALSERFRVAAEKLSAKGERFACRGGLIASGDVFVSDAALKRRIAEEFHAVAAEMEGAAIAQVAWQNGVTFALVRAISDLADGSAAPTSDEFEHLTADRVSHTLIELLRDF